MNSILSKEAINEQSLQNVAAYFAPRTVTLYDQFNRPIFVASSAPKIGRTINVRRPRLFKDS